MDSFIPPTLNIIIQYYKGIIDTHCVKTHQPTICQLGLKLNFKSEEILKYEEIQDGFSKGVCVGGVSVQQNASCS